MSTPDPFDQNNPLDAGGGSTGDDVDATSTGGDSRELNVSGIISIIVFYLVVLAVGVWAGWRQKRQRASQDSPDQEEVMIAGRNIGLFVGILTMGGEIKILPKEICYKAEKTETGRLWSSVLPCKSNSVIHSTFITSLMPFFA